MKLEIEDRPSRVWDLFFREANASHRTPEQHMGHILSRRYMELRRICWCGFYVYRVTDDLKCFTCGEECCPWCGTSFDDRDFCHLHAPPEGGVTRHGR